VKGDRSGPEQGGSPAAPGRAAPGLDRPITRRDFCNGLSVAVLGAGLSALPVLPASAGSAATQSAPVYPPALTGLRGNHVGSFEVAHALAREGRRFDAAQDLDEPIHDLIVVGGGLSGLAAAYLYRKNGGTADRRVLILDNHDDFGGHAKRNEFDAGSRRLIGYGGSQSIDTPSRYSPVAKQLLVDLGIRLKKFYRAFDQTFFESRGLDEGIFFDAASFGKDQLVVGNLLQRFRRELPADADLAGYVARLPLSADARAQMLAILTQKPQGGLPADRDAAVAQLHRVSYDDFLRRSFGASDETIRVFQQRPSGFWGVGTDALSAYEAMKMGFPGFSGLGIRPCEAEGAYAACGEAAEPYIFHFPDGNASVARLIVRSLVPRACPGHTMEDIVTARMDYARLDEDESPTRIRLNATGVRVLNAKLADGTPGVEVTYVRHGAVQRVRGRHAILAGYNMMIPYLCPELPEDQKQALHWPVKVPLVYVNVMIRNWQSFHKLGIRSAYFPGGFFTTATLDFPVSLGGYTYPSNPSEPTLLHLTHVPTFPGQGLIPREQHRMGHYALLTTPFDVFERHVREQLAALLGPAGFDAAADILAITVNRWPHGYAYEYNELFDPEWKPGEAPHEIGRRRFGRISIANSDAEAHAYVDGAINAAHRAVGEVLGT
jgi:spermidine dehydrogenase